ncbi:hypothetical protein DL98DRAFT_595182 [Cadophora sp. DSE1049]|nr:hypothetical protein DL98DRAFT_595182 [Cadophora sp. DSE1049]
MTRASAYNALQLNTELVNGVNMSRKGSNSSLKHPDSAVHFNSPLEATKDSPIEDEAIENPVYEFLKCPALSEPSAFTKCRFPEQLAEGIVRVQCIPWNI